MGRTLHLILVTFTPLVAKAIICSLYLTLDRYRGLFPVQPLCPFFLFRKNASHILRLLRLLGIRRWPPLRRLCKHTSLPNECTDRVPEVVQPVYRTSPATSENRNLATIFLLQ